MKTVSYFHWHKEEAGENVKRIQELGFDAKHELIESQKDFARLRSNPPDVFVIDLSRIPSHGREIGTALRSYKSTQIVPIVFLGGEKEKVERVKKDLPDAFYAEWRNLKSVIGRALKSDTMNVIIKKNILEAYAGTPIVKKVGINEEMKVGLINPPKNIKSILGELPAKAKLINNSKHPCDLILWFALLMVELESEIEHVIPLINEKGSIWIFWQKQKGKVKSELRQQDVRNVGLKNGLVDFKVCSLDETWSGLKFTRRKK